MKIAWDKPDFGFLRYERHVLDCQLCAPVRSRHLLGEKRPPYCSVGEVLWKTYLFPASAISTKSCRSCSDQISETGPSACSTCRSKDVLGHLARRQLRKSHGLCVSCGFKPPECDRLSCETCLEDDAERAKAVMAIIRSRRSVAGLCRCGEPRVQGKRSCEPCLVVGRSRYHRSLASGLCGACGQSPPRAGARTCEVCRIRENERKRLARMAGEGARVRRAA